jgi:hypothetical protein
MEALKMANVKFKWWGFNVMLTHSEACILTEKALPAAELAIAITQMFGGVTAFGQIVLIAIRIAINESGDYIRRKNTRSGYKGVRLKFLYGAPPLYVGVARRGDSSDWGRSPC